MTIAFDDAFHQRLFFITLYNRYTTKRHYSGHASAMCKGGDAGARLSVAIAKLRPTVQGALERSDPQRSEG